MSTHIWGARCTSGLKIHCHIDFMCYLVEWFSLILTLLKSYTCQCLFFSHTRPSSGTIAIVAKAVLL
jgi:hypothetical protein